ncbi:cupin domain-containing protein [Pseudonocardia spinosispora]|uniref:cupin domain-containing protein n=1 Tax=Pseudonocardia spinosispora TaxID=103441 RepID=UPI00040828B0|nr:cupin domain-containing protein [Pseudonocardia spinosispora]
MTPVVRTEADVQARRVDGDSVTEFELFGPGPFAEAMTQRVLRCRPGRSLPRRDDRCDQLLYVLSGSGRIEVEDRSEALAPGTAALVPAGKSWTITADRELSLANTSVPAPPGPRATALHRAPGPWSLTRHLGAQEKERATSDREFEVLFSASTGSAGATQFVGYIPPSGAPEHYHLYEEFCVILRGAGAVNLDGGRHELTVGSTFHILPGLLHSVENTGTDDLWLLGVFRPAGSAAAAYYPDGRPAPNNRDEE